MGGTDLRDPGYRYVFKLADGESFTLHPRDAKRTVDRRNEHAPVQTVWEVTVRGVVRRLWPEEIAEWSQEPVG